MANYYLDDNGKLTKKKKGQGTNYVMDDNGNISASKEEEDIAPVKDTEKDTGDKDERRWFEKGAFEDGYQFGDVAKTIWGSSMDLGESVTAGILGIGEAVVDAGAYVAGGAAKLFGNDEFADKTKDFIAKDLYDEREVARKLLKPQQPLSYALVDPDEDSVLGDKTDSVAQSAGQLLGTAGLQMAGVPWWLTTGVTGFGSEAENAFNQGATYAEAGASAAISAGAEILTEKLFSGISFGGKTAEDVLITPLVNKISSKIGRTLVNFGIDAVGEGFEEILSSAASRLGSALYKEENWKELVWSEEALDEYIESFIGGAVLGGGMGGFNAANAIANGTDYKTGMTESEQKVFDKEVENRIAEKQKDGKKLTNKEKAAIEEAVKTDMERGYLSTDTIESVLGGESYQAQQTYAQEAEALQTEIEQIEARLEGDVDATEQKALRERLKQARTELKEHTDGIGEYKSNTSKFVTDALLGERRGKGSLLVESYNERARRGQAFEADMDKYTTKEQAVIRKAIDSGILNNTNRTHDFVDMIAKISAEKGVLFDFTNNTKLKESGFAVEGKTVNGFVTKDGVTVNIDSAKSLNSVVGHEITHVLEGTELYNELQKAVMKYAEAKGELATRKSALTQLYKGIKGANVDAELTADLVGDYLFTDADFIRNLSTEHRNVFQKIYDEVKYLIKVAKAGSKEARELERVKRAFDKAYKEGGKKQTDTKYSLAMVEGVRPKSDAWKPGATTDEVRAAHPTLYAVDEDATTERNPTQVKGTVGSYRKIYNALQSEGFHGTILDASSGLGYGTRAGIEEYGFDVEDIEPYPDSDYKPKYTDYSRLNKKYDVVISNAVLNVLPQDQRDALVEKMGELLNDGGRMFVNVRGKDVMNASGKIAIDEANMEYFIPRTAKTGSYQKGFTKAELVAYLQDALGDGFTVKSTNMFGAVSAVVTKDGGVKYSLTDSEGRQLSKEQQEYFKDSKVRDENGNLKVMYHGTSYGGFTVFEPFDSSRFGLFGAGTYFTDNKDIAESYTDKGRGNTPQVYESYLNIKNPIDMDAQGDYDAWKDAFPDADFPKEGTNEQFFREMVEVFRDEEYPTWEAKDTAMNVLQRMGYDGITHIGGGRVIADSPRHQVYIVFEPEQIKNIDNAKPTENPDIRFSLSESVEESGGLMALHNLKGNELLKSLELGGLPMPSIAVIKAEAGHDQYGEVSLILPKEAIDPKANRANKVYGGDAWTPTYPKIEYKPNEAVAKKISDKYYELYDKYGSEAARPLYNFTYDLENVLNGHGGEAAMLEDLYGSTKLMQAYLLDAGKGKVEHVKKEIRTELSDAEVEMNDFFINELGADVVDGVMAREAESPSEHRIRYWKEHGEKIKESCRKLLAEEYGFSPEEIDNVLSGMKTFDYLKFVRDAYLYRKNGRVTTKTETDYEATDNAIKEAAGEGYKAWVDNLFKGIEEKSGIRNNADYFTNSGNRRSWDALHWENTLENVVRVMKQQNQTGADAIFGAHQIFATAAKDYGSIAEIKADSHRLYKMSEDEYEAVKDSYTNRMHQIVSRIMDKGERNQFIALDNAMECIVDAVRSSKTQAGIYKELSQYRQLNVTEQDVADIVSLVNDIANMPTGYFEAKPMRAVGFDEVGVFVIPRNADVKLKRELLNRGYAIAEYDPDVEGDRQKVVNSFEEYKFSLSDVGVSPKQYGNYNVYGNDVALQKPSAKATETVAPVENAVDNTVAPVEEVAPVVEESPNAAIAEIASQARRENMRGAYTQDGKQYLTDGSFVAEFNTVDESLKQAVDFPAKKVLGELAEAFERQLPGEYSIDGERMAEIGQSAGNYVKVGNFLYDAKYVDALIRAIGNPTFALSNVRGGYNALVVTGDNGRAVIMPVRAGDNANVAYEATMAAQDDFAPITEEDANALQSEAIDSITDADAPPEMDAPYYADNEAVAADNPFEDRDIKEVGKRSVKAYMYENPEVKPFFQEEANIMLGELRDTVKGEKWFDDKLYYETNGEAGWGGTSRHTSADIAYLLDELKYSYAEIEQGLKDIIEDHGEENNACSKRIEFILNDRLMKGYQAIDGFDIPANQEYIKLLEEKQITEYNEDNFKSLFADAPQEDIAPVEVAATKEPVVPVKPYASEAIKPKPVKQPRMARATPEEQLRLSEDIAPTYESTSDKQVPGQRRMFAEGNTAEVLEGEPQTAQKQSRIWTKFRNNFLDKQSVFEDLALKTHNRELMGKANYMLSSESRAQWMIGHGAPGVKSLNDIRSAVEKTGLTKQFSEYLYHVHNVDRMTLDVRFGTENKAVFGDSVTAEVSRAEVKKLEAQYPKFKSLANDIYAYNKHLRQQMVKSGVISQETADLWDKMYPHYVPIRRVGESELGVYVPLDSRKTGVNAPIKRATGGSSDILPLFDTMAMRTEQTYKAIAKNRFGVELKNTLGTTVETQNASLDEVIDSIDAHEELLQKGKNGLNPTFTVFENGKRVTFEISEDMYDALKPTAEGLKTQIKPLAVASTIQKGLLTEYNPVFMATNAIKDAQDILINSQHPAKTYAKLPAAFKELATKGKWYNEYMANGGEQNTYFDGQSNTFKKADTGIKKIVGMPLRAISAMNNFFERAPRLAEYIASREAGASAEVAMLDAARVTTNFQAGGDVTRWANRNGFTFLNASVQGFNQQVRNVREAKANGLKGWAQLAAKVAVAGLPAMLLNNLLWDDDEEYEELSDYVKQNYYVVAKYGDGKFVRIPKGRTLAVIQNAFEQMSNALTGNDEVDLKSFVELVISNLAPNNPLDNNIVAPIMQAYNNETWYGEALVPQRLQDLPKAEQYDESTDEISKWLGEKLNVSPYKLNYLLNQYSGGVGDVVLPFLTPEAERGDSSMLAPFADKFTTDSVMNNQNVSDFYDTMDTLTANAKSVHATDEDVLKYKYFNTVNADLSELYQQKREIQSSNLSDADKYSQMRQIQEQINALTKDSLDTYGRVNIDGSYASIGDVHFRLTDKGEWQKITDKQLEKQEEVTGGLGISASDYWSNKEEYDYAYENPERYAVSHAVGGYDAWKTYSSELYDIKADKDEDGKSISGSRKEKVIAWINEQDMDYGAKIILFKSEYPADDTYNADIVEYLNNREDITYEQMVTILKELGFKVNGNSVTWD